jgi:hypothetical protein
MKLGTHHHGQDLAHVLIFYQPAKRLIRQGPCRFESDGVDSLRG